MIGNRLLRVMQQTAQPSMHDIVGLIFGEVVSASPLEIKLDQKLTITEDFIILSQLVKKKSIKFEFYVEDILQEIEVDLWGDLEVGDKVRVLRTNQGQLYYILDREEIGE